MYSAFWRSGLLDLLKGVGMTDKARELLERALDGLNWYEYKDLMEEIRAYLAEPKQDEEPKTHEPWCAYLTQMLMSNPPQRSECNCKNTTAPRKEFVRLSEEEIMDLCRGKCVEFRWPSTAIETARAIEDALEEANRYKPFVRLSEEEVSEILSSTHTPYEAICAAENRLERKNK